MMTFEDKCNYAIKELENAGIWKSNYNPPILKLARKLGFKVPFPHYNSFLNNALSAGIYFGVFWGLFMYFIVWGQQNMPATKMLSAATLAGAFFGLSMASYYKYSFKKNKLTPWCEIKNN
ncbi:hypothetical protein HQN60_12735 [Deefgea piscis]|uniref:Uncharacterized protein n=1 Tax=Deefgea piscis TaxID=2739061 RepID=A0A6M8SQG0_9NEIS|nr:DUF6404 family protein [Deefgea piscis]QKJ67502.1 hypothetical protein HQN60_12735 [Deefgea piscis]